MILLKGIGTSPYIGVGEVKKIEGAYDPEDVIGKIVVVSRASRDMLSHLQNASGVVTDYGGITSHVAIVLREMRVPCIVGTEYATQILEDGMLVTVDGNTGNIYGGFIEIEDKADLFEVYNPSTAIKVNLNVPELAEITAPFTDGVGSIRIENMVIHRGKHPQKLLDEGRLTDIITEEVRKIVDAFYPKPVWFRTFDIATDELKRLDGGEIEFEEANPLLGFRGIYKDIKNVEILKSEFKAVRNLLDEGYDNIAVKIPFIRDVSEYVQAKKILNEIGIKPHRDLQVGASFETPSAVLTMDEFIENGIDFASIGMSDLTMCTLAVDRRGVRVAKHFNLLHPAVLRLVKMIIIKCNEIGIESCICGHAASDPVIVEKLIGYGISSISTNPDQILKMRKFMYRTENGIVLKNFSEHNL
jgi:pyruvate,water dikinase